VSSGSDSAIAPNADAAVDPADRVEDGFASGTSVRITDAIIEANGRLSSVTIDQAGAIS
jgi:hypothetical protein